MHRSPLFRKENTTAHRPNRRSGGDYRDDRHSKQGASDESMRTPMHSKARRGRDYTPLFRFLLAKVGNRWAEIYSEAVSRLDCTEPIFWLVATNDAERRDYIRTGESSYFSGLYVDESGLLQVVNPNLGPASLAPTCKCCTHTFNGVRFTRSFREPAPPVNSDEGQLNVVS